MMKTVSMIHRLVQRRLEYVDWGDVFMKILLIGFALFIVFLVSIFILAAYYDVPNFSNCSPLANGSNICYYHGFSNASNISTKIINN